MPKPTIVVAGVLRSWLVDSRQLGRQDVKFSQAFACLMLNGSAVEIVSSLRPFLSCPITQQTAPNGAWLGIYAVGAQRCSCEDCRFVDQPVGLSGSIGGTHTPRCRVGSLKQTARFRLRGRIFRGAMAAIVDHGGPEDRRGYDPGVVSVQLFRCRL